MNLDGKGWFEKYLKFREGFNPTEEDNKLTTSISFPDLSLYKLVQPTGLIYGHPVQLPYADHQYMLQIKVGEKMKIILTESFIHNLFIKHGNEMVNLSDQKELLNLSSQKLIEFYGEVYPEYRISDKNFWGRPIKDLEKAEIILQKRMNIRGGFTKNFWSSFFHNSLLFLDVFYFGEWINPTTEIKSLEEIRKEKEDMRFSILKVIASAAYADKKLEKEELMLFKYFLKSAHLSPDKEKEAKGLIEAQIGVEDLDLPKQNESWLLKKYFLEVALLTLWADRVVTEEEKLYLNQLCNMLGFSSDELESSMVAIESFVLENWEKVHYLRDKKDYTMVSEKFMQRLTFMVNQNKDRVVQEINESKELMVLLAKSRKQSLTQQEKEIVRAQLLDILKLLPAFVVIALPFTFITLPVLIKILPKSILPSAFQD